MPARAAYQAEQRDPAQLALHHDRSDGRSGKSAKVSNIDWCLAAMTSAAWPDVLQAAHLELGAGEHAQKEEADARPEPHDPGAGAAAAEEEDRRTDDHHDVVTT